MTTSGSWVAPNADHLDRWSRFCELCAGGSIVALTGAGVSTDSGIADYRDDEGRWKHQQPLQYREFVSTLSVQKRYWARSFKGFAHLATAQPNAAHVSLSLLEQRGVCSHIITQNVDGLHQRAGSRSVIDLHGRIDRVICLSCGAAVPRTRMQEWLSELNPEWANVAFRATPDGDAELLDADYESFRIARCACGGTFKPDVVFFGEHVPRERVAACLDAVQRAKALLIVGTSLMVFSGYRFARVAHREGIPIVVINRGKTRADDISTLCYRGNAGVLLSELLEASRALSQ